MLVVANKKGGFVALGPFVGLAVAGGFVPFWDFVVGTVGTSVTLGGFVRDALGVLVGLTVAGGFVPFGLFMGLTVAGGFVALGVLVGGDV